MDDFNEENQFIADEVSAIIRETVETIIGGQDFSNEHVKHWTTSILESSMAGLTALQKPFKYTVNCSLMQKSGCGLHTVSSCLWDVATDGCCTVRWENKSVTCIVSVFALSL